MRFTAQLALSLSIVALGCGGTEHAPLETPEQGAERIFALAQNLEKEHKTKEAFAAYRQIVRNYPATVGGKKAAQRLDEVQKAAMRRRAR